MQDEESQQEPESEWSQDLEQRPDRRVWLWVSVIVVVLLAAGLGGPPLYKQGKAIRARRLVDEAQEDFRNLRFTNGAPKLRTAVGLAPDDSNVLRLAAETLTLLGLPEAIPYWSRLEQKGELTEKDRLNRARLALNLVRLDLAGSDLETLYRKSPTNSEVLGLSIDLFQRLGNPRKAREAAAELIKVDPKSASGRLAAGALLSTDPTSPADRRKGRELLMGLAVEDNPQQTNAWRILGTLTDLEPELCLRLAGIFTNRTPFSLDDLVAAAEFSRKADSNSVPSWTRRLAEAAKGNHGVPGFGNAMVQLLDWKAYREVLAAVDGDAAMKSTELYAIRVQALSLLEDWEQVRQAVENPEAPLSRFERALFRGGLAFQTGKKPEAMGLWREAEAAATNQVQLRQFAQFAEQMGQWEMAATAWQRLLPAARDRFAVALGFLQAARRSGNDRLNLEAHRRFLDVVPADMGIRSESVYLQLVLGENTDSIATQINSLPAEIRKSHRMQFLEAFLELRKGNMSEGLASLERLSFDWERMEPRWKALYAALLSANGQREAARRISSGIRPNQLSSAERECFATWVPTLR